MTTKFVPVMKLPNAEAVWNAEWNPLAIMLRLLAATHSIFINKFTLFIVTISHMYFITEVSLCMM